MENKTGKLVGVIIGLCLIICGVLFILRDYFTLPLGSIVCMMMGFICVVYYFDRRKVWALAAGMYLLYWGIISCFFSEIYFKNLAAAMFFLAPGLTFDVLYIDNRKRYQLMLGSILTCLGIGAIIEPFFYGGSVAVMPLSIGVAFIVDYIFSGDYTNRWGMYFGVIMCLYALQKVIPVESAINIIAAAALIVAGAVIIFRTLKGERR